MAYLNTSPQALRHLLLRKEVPVDSGKKWIKIGRYERVNSQLYQKIWQSIPTDRKAYAVGFYSSNLGRYRYFTHVSFSLSSVSVDEYTTTLVGGLFTGKRYDTSQALFDVNVMNTSYDSKSTYKKKGKVDDEWSTESLVSSLPKETISYNDGEYYVSCFVHYFEQPLYLVQIQEAVNVEQIYILIDRQPEPQELKLFID